MIQEQNRNREDEKKEKNYLKGGLAKDNKLD